MEEVFYLAEGDEEVFNKLLSEGLTKEQANQQMKLMGFNNTIILINCM